MWGYVNRKIFMILLSLSLISVACVFPYILSVQRELLRQVGQPLGVIFIAQFIQSFILFSILIYLGLFFAKKINFKTPLIEAILGKSENSNVFKGVLGISILWGIFAAVLIYVLDPIFTMNGVGISTHDNLAPVWQKLLAAVYGGVTEEIVMRLFLMTFFIWVGMKLFRKDQPTKTGIIVSIVIAAIVFGLGHLPITASITKIDFLTVTRAIILNGIGGVIFGYLFWKKGLESAMIAHFTTDIFLLSLFPIFFN